MTSEHTTLADALLAFQAELPHVGKDNEADTGKYKYKYADLTTLTEIAIPLLNRHGLVWTTCPGVGEFGAVLNYELRHGAESITGNYPLGAANQLPQSLGSAITYARRYALCAVTGIAPGGDDDDARAAQIPPQAAQAAVDPILVDEWVEALNNAGTVQHLQTAWEAAGKAGVTRHALVVAAKDARKKALA